LQNATKNSLNAFVFLDKVGEEILFLDEKMRGPKWK